jgi:hypothetical protein
LIFLQKPAVVWANNANFFANILNIITSVPDLFYISQSKSVPSLTLNTIRTAKETDKVIT